MSDDLKAYIDGELPPDAAERLRLALEQDASLGREAAELRQLSEALRRLPEPEPVGQAATIAALVRPRPLWQGWTVSLAGCAAVLFAAVWISTVRTESPFVPAGIEGPIRPKFVAEPIEVELPSVRRFAFERFIKSRGGMVRPDGDGLRAFYDPGTQAEVIRRFNFPEGTQWAADGLRVRLTQ